MKLVRPTYEALDNQGRPRARPALVIGELPHADRGAALASATQAISAILGVAAPRRVHFGVPVFVAFGISRPLAKSHPEAALLLTRGESLQLSLCHEYARQE